MKAYLQKPQYYPQVRKKSKGPSLSNIPKLVDNSRGHIEKTLSQAQRDQLLMNTSKEDLRTKKEMMESFPQSNKTLEESISKMTRCLTSLGDGIASGKQMLAMALSGQPQNNVHQVSHPHFNTYSGFASPPSYGNNKCTPLTRRSVPSQFNRIGSEEVMQSILGRGTILGPTRTLLED